MIVSVSWLRALAPGLEGGPEELADRLSGVAAAVDRVERVGEGLDGLVVARVVEARPHPNADRLTLCEVDPGEKVTVEVVCGAPNVREGALYAYVPPGAVLPDGMRIEARKLRGIVSHGMLCSERELGLGREHGGILRLPDELEPGTPLREALGLPDARLEIDLTPNRVDLAGHVGVARELTPEGVEGIELPGFGTGWSPRWTEDREEVEAAGVRVRIEDPERCSRYLAAVVRGLRVGPSPAWLANRLRSIGQRPINNVVDATNYVLHELNQPLHAFDLDTLAGPEVRVRAAGKGERIRTLDGQEREPGPAATVIADAEGPVALAGVMGGVESEVGGGTTAVLLECAAFDPSHTRHTARAAGLSTDASYRFERGIDERGLELALERCVELVLAVAGGEAEAVAWRVGEPPPERRRLRLRPDRARRLLGLTLGAGEIAALLRPIGFEVSGEEGPLQVLVPGWRRDVEREVDLLEEVARRHGYDRFPETPPAARPTRVPEDPAWPRADRVREHFVGEGLVELRGAAVVPVSLADAERPVELLNPLSSEERALRGDLLAALLRRLEHNFSRGRRDVRVFEIGTVFRAAAGATGTGEHDPAGFAEELRVGVLLTGRRRPLHWSEEPEDVDVWELKGLAEAAAARLWRGRVEPRETAPAERSGVLGALRWIGEDAFHLLKGERIVGVAGRIRPEVVDAPPWGGPVWGAEFLLEAVEPRLWSEHRPIPPFPSVQRDLAFTVPRALRAAEVGATLREAAPDLLERLELFDVYEGEEIGSDRRSLAWRLTFRAPDRTLTDEEVEAAMTPVLATLRERYDARVRDG